MVLKIQPGVMVIFNGQRYKVKSPFSLQRVFIEPIESGEAIAVLVSELQPNLPLEQQSREKKGIVRDIIEFTDQEWNGAKKREKLIQPYVSIVCSREEAQKIGHTLGITARYVYKWGV